jgi:hypothetical protein
VFGREPDYSEILDEIAKSPSDRMQLLRSYFEPSVAHSRCTIINVNGDYLDARLRNTTGELAGYEPKMERLLDQVFDEYGLIVCGWSGDWDIALRSAIERCPTRRFTTYWSPYSKLGEAAQRLVNHRRATVLGMSGADDLFKDLLDKISALERLHLTGPTPTKVAVARMKKYLPDEAHRITLSELISAEAERAYTAVMDTTKDIIASDPHAGLRFYESAVDTLLNLMICGGYWAQPHQDEILSSSLKRLADQGIQRGSPVLELLWRYPALLLLYGVGLAALGRPNYCLLQRLLYLSVRNDNHDPEEPLAKVLSHAAVMGLDYQREVFSRNTYWT